MQKYKITSTSVVFSENEIQSHFPNVGFAFPLGQDILDHFGLELVAPTAGDVAAELATAKAAKNTQINVAREQANLTTFTHLGKSIACDSTSQRDIDKILGTIIRTNAFPPGFPGAWKAADNTYLPLPNLAAFDAMYASMVMQGLVNFAKSEALKTALASALTIAQVAAIVVFI